MNYLDIIIAVLLIAFGYGGWRKGIIIEVTTLLGLGVGLYGAFHHHHFYRGGDHCESVGTAGIQDGEGDQFGIYRQIRWLFGGARQGLVDLQSFGNAAQCLELEGCCQRRRQAEVVVISLRGTDGAVCLSRFRHRQGGGIKSIWRSGR